MKDIDKQGRVEAQLGGRFLALGLKPKAQYRISRMKVDFAFVEDKVVIELDGHHHHTPEQKSTDKRRDAVCRAEGWQVWRYKTDDAFPDASPLAHKIHARLKHLRARREEKEKENQKRLFDIKKEIIKKNKIKERELIIDSRLFLALSAILIIISLTSTYNIEGAQKSRLIDESTNNLLFVRDPVGDLNPDKAFSKQKCQELCKNDRFMIKICDGKSTCECTSGRSYWKHAEKNICKIIYTVY